MEEKIELINTGYQDCGLDMHSWGPGMRPCYIIHYVDEGSGWLETGGRKYHVSSGQCFLTYPYEKIFYYPDKDSPWKYYWVDFVGSDVDKALEKCFLKAKNPVGLIGEPEIIKAYFERLQHVDIHSANRQEANGILKSILGLLQDMNENSGNEEKIDLYVNLIHSNFHRASFGVQDICQVTGVSQATLYRKFMEEFGVSPKQYLTNYRLKQAKYLLLLDNSVKATAMSCGYEDQLYFSRLFKKYEGVSPSQFAVNKGWN